MLKSKPKVFICFMNKTQKSIVFYPVIVPNSMVRKYEMFHVKGLEIAVEVTPKVQILA